MPLKSNTSGNRPASSGVRPVATPWRSCNNKHSFNENQKILKLPTLPRTQPLGLPEGQTVSAFTLTECCNIKRTLT